MTIRAILALLLSTSAASLAEAKAPSKWADLSRHERLYAERMAVQADHCENEDCRDQIILKIAQVITLRRSVRGELLSDYTQSRLQRSCDEHEENLQAMVDCLRARQNVSFEDGMRLAGFTQAGITSEGYSQIRIGMEMREVEYILDDFGEELSYVASGGYSASTYQWTAGRRIIIVSFADYKVSGRSQNGLYRN